MHKHYFIRTRIFQRSPLLRRGAGYPPQNMAGQLTHVHVMSQLMREPTREAEMQTKTYYRAMCFGKPIAPWRGTRDEARRDLAARELGSFDEWGFFWVTVPGELAVKRVAASQSRAA
jgi:hypothetical protein